MNPRSRIGRTIKQSLLRGIALLFLFYTAVDIALPQYHRNESLDLSISLPTTHAAGESNEAVAALPSIPDERSDERESPRDEDCFCCCSHVIPGRIFGDSSIAELVLFQTFIPKASLPTPPVQNPYHPPRFA